MKRFPALPSLNRISIRLALTVGLLAGALIAVAAPSASTQAQGGNEPEVLLYPGWNNLLYQGIALPLPDALNDARESVTTVWQFVAPSQEWRVWRAELPEAVLSLPGLEPGGIYFLFSNTTRAWTQPLTPPPAPPPPPEPPAPQLWAITFTRSASIFGLEQRIQFDEAGVGTAQRSGDPEQPLTVGATARAAIESLLDANGFFAAHAPNTATGCVNCFAYRIEIRDRAGSVLVLETDDGGLNGDPALFALVDQVSAILIAAVGL